MSGNGTRIAAAWLAERTGAREVIVAVGGRAVSARMLSCDEVETDVGTVAVGEVEALDVHGNAVELTPVSVGNPHAVIYCAEPAREVLLRLGPLVETHARFPARTNVQLAHADGPHDVTALVWERGAGETSASGSSAVAVAAAAIAHGWCVSPVTVHMPGGDLQVRFENGRATLIGPAKEICRGELSDAPSQPARG
jgi:diaminopimelate epimerase